MSVAPTGIEAKILQRIIDALAPSQHFHAFARLAGADVETQARARILRLSGPVLDVEHALLYPPRLPLRATAGGSLRGQAEASVHFLAPPVAGDGDEDRETRSWNYLSGIRADLAAAFGRHLVGVDAGEPVELDDSVGLDGWMDFALDLQLAVAL